MNETEGEKFFAPTKEWTQTEIYTDGAVSGYRTSIMRRQAHTLLRCVRTSAVVCLAKSWMARCD